uniref:tubulin-glutamate carboxypeptidase n=1 Tax=Latimeria chalumnae TaxID=7897 RepID=H3B6W6_LATCH
DRKFGQKAQTVEATDIILSLLRQNLSSARTFAPCLWILQLSASSISTATILGSNGALEMLFKLVTPYTKKHTRKVKAAVDALAALLKSKLNCQRAVSSGYVYGLLKIYQEWHRCDSSDSYVVIRRALLRCLKHVTHIRNGRKAFLNASGMKILLTTSQACLSNRSPDLLIDAATQIMRKCYPKCPLPLTMKTSSYSFPLPGAGPAAPQKTPVPEVYNSDEEGEEEEADSENEETENKEEDDDLETDLNKLRVKPKLDRSLEELKQYERLCPELLESFQELESESEDSSEDDLPSPRPRSSRIIPSSGVSAREPWTAKDQSPLVVERGSAVLRPGLSVGADEEADGATSGHSRSERRPAPKEAPCLHAGNNGPGHAYASKSTAEDERLEASTFHRQCTKTLSQSNNRDGGEENQAIVAKLLERHKGNVLFHDPRVYTAMAAKTQSIADYGVLAFPDFWGHFPPPFKQQMLERKSGVQTMKIFEDVQRLTNPEDVLNKVVFSLDETSPPKDLEEADSLKFFSRFESGNLRKAIQVRRFEYDLILNSDVNCSGHPQWFYFEVSRMKAGVPYRFNIINCEKANSQFNYGMQPTVFSVCEALRGTPHWFRAGTHISYYKNHYFQSVAASGRQRRQSYYTLTFTVTFPHPEDVCYVAYHYPYTYSTLLTHLYLLEKSLNPKKVYFRHHVLCDTLGGNRCPLVTITSAPKSKHWQNLHQFRNRPYLVLTARVHPGESNASWVMKGTLEFLTSDDPVAVTLRETYIVKVIPMLNPDGVINGNHRCSLSGEDLNRQWSHPDPVLHPTIYHAKGLLQYLTTTGKPPLVFCDYHGHSRKKNVFLYGCSVKETFWQSQSPVDTSILKEDVGYRTLAKILDQVAPAFVLNSCSFLVEKSRASTARVVVWREVGVLRSYTMESTYCGCNQGRYEASCSREYDPRDRRPSLLKLYTGFQIGTEELEEMGAKFCFGLLLLKKRSLPYNKQLLCHVPSLLDLEDEPLDQRSI